MRKTVGYRDAGRSRNGHDAGMFEPGEDGSLTKRDAAGSDLCAEVDAYRVQRPSR